MVVEQHAAMRFAWLRERAGRPAPDKLPITHPASLITVLYNLIWWVPIVLGFAKVIDYRVGSIAFLAITVFRAAANLFRNNVLSPDRGEVFPLRAP